MTPVAVHRHCLHEHDQDGYQHRSPPIPSLGGERLQEDNDPAFALQSRHVQALSIGRAVENATRSVSCGRVERVSRTLALNLPNVPLRTPELTL